MSVVLPRKKSQGEGTQVTKIADESISALRVVAAVSETNVALADKDSFQDAKALGVSINAANTGENVKVVTFGEIKDSFFNFPLNEPLFLGDNGVITDIAPSDVFNTTIGHSLGPGAIFVNIREPIEL